MASAELQFERSLYIGNTIGGILYGAQLILCFQSIYFLARQSPMRKKNMFYILFSIAITVFGTIGLATNVLFGQFMWIDYRSIPGGPPAYFADNSNVWFSTLGTSAAAAAIFMGDGLLLFRCYTILGSKPWVAIFLGSMFLASTALSIVSTIASAAPNHFILSGTPAQFGTAWISLTVGYNGIVTAMICLRLLQAHRVLKVYLPQEVTNTYTSVVAILVESALPYTLLGIVFAVLYGRNDVTSIAFASIWGIVTILSPQLIILRVAMGIAWSRDTLSSVHATELRFQAAQVCTSEEQGDF